MGVSHAKMTSLDPDPDPVQFQVVRCHGLELPMYEQERWVQVEYRPVEPPLDVSCVAPMPSARSSFESQTPCLSVL